jgi:hypothetical protein
MPDLAALCRAAGTTPATLARLCGRSPRVGYDWATGRTPTPPEVLAWLERRLADPPPLLPRYVPVPRGRRGR